VTKFLVADETGMSPSFVLKTAVKTTAAGGESDFGSGAMEYGVTGVASKEMGDLTIHGMVGYAFPGSNDGTDLRDVVSYGCAGEFSLPEGFHLVAEAVGSTNPDRAEEGQLVSVMVGITLSISDHVSIDSATRIGVTRSMPEWGHSVGLTVSL
jgi:hypothetical protein